ncbi:pentapeptide repeat-containing protein [Chryseobacterium indoltheticum]
MFDNLVFAETEIINPYSPASKFVNCTFNNCNFINCNFSKSIFENCMFVNQ